MTGIIDYEAIAKLYRVDKREAEKIYANAMSITKKIVGNIPDEQVELKYEEELTIQYQDLLMRASDQNYKREKTIGGQPMKNNVMKENTGSVKDHYDYLNAMKDIDPEDFNSSLRYYAIKKWDWNNRKIRLHPDEIKDLVNFQKALDKMGIGNREFMSYREKTIGGQPMKNNVMDYLNGKVSLDDLTENFDMKEYETSAEMRAKTDKSSMPGKRKKKDIDENEVIDKVNGVPVDDEHDIKIVVEKNAYGYGEEGEENGYAYGDELLTGDNAYGYDGDEMKRQVKKYTYGESVEQKNFLKKIKEMVNYYAVVQAGGPIYGVGKSKKDAIKDSMEWLDRETNPSDIIDINYDAEWGKALSYDALVCIPCTEDVYNMVIKSGGDIMYDVDNGILSLD